MERDYQLATDHATGQIRADLERAHYRALGLQPDEEGATAWRQETTPTGGDINVLPPGRSGGGIELRWQGTRLMVSLRGRDMH
jgi:hypothetical protein